MTGPRREILLVEDQPADVEFIVESLRDVGLAGQLRVARDGVEALQLLGLAPDAAPPAPDALPGLVLLDIKLPRVNGLEVLQRIKGHPDTEAIPVVIFTSSNLARDIAQCYRHGANSYVQKPVEFAQFRAVVQQLGAYWLSVNAAPVPGHAGDARG